MRIRPVGQNHPVVHADGEVMRAGGQQAEIIFVRRT